MGVDDGVDDVACSVMMVAVVMMVMLLREGRRLIKLR